MRQNVTLRAPSTIDAPRAEVWNALVRPVVIKQCTFGAQVVSDGKDR